MSHPPRKFTFETSRERAEEMLRLYEAGSSPKALAEQFCTNVDAIWQKIKQGRKWRARKASEAAE